MQNPIHSFTAAFASVLALVGGLTLAAGVAAQEEESSTALEEVIVTASRREEKLQDTAVAVTVLDVNELADSGLTGLPEILPFVPGVSVVDSGGPFNSSVYVRGINATLAAGVVSYVDDIPYGSSTVYSNPTPLDGTLLDLSSLDVLRGPQGTLYGASAMGGVLKFVTRKASLEEWTASASADLSSTRGGGLNQLYRVNANGPLVANTLGVSFTAFWKDKSGYIDNVVIPKNGWDDYQYYGYSGSLRWTPTERLEITLQGLYQNSQQDGFATIQANHADDMFLPGVGAGQSWYGDYKTGQADVNPSEYDASVVGLTINYEFDFGTLTSVTSSQDMTFTNSLDVSVPYAAYADAFFPDNAPHSTALFVGEQGFDKVTQELRLTSKSNQQFEWIVGAFYNKEDGFNIQRLDTQPAEPDFYAADFPSTYKETSVFATGTWYFTPNLDASVGARYADYSNEVALTTRGPLIAPLPLNKIDDNVTNYLFNLRYRAGENLSFYGRVASGYRPGGANFLLLDPTTGEPLNDPFYKPDSLWSYEAGMKGVTADGRLNYDLAVFYIDWKDYIITFVRNGVNVVANADKAISRGIEATLSYAVTDSLTVGGNVSYVNAELAADDQVLGAADGTQLPNSPEWQGSVNVDYRFELGELPAYLGGSWRYKGDMPVGFPGYTDSNGMTWPPSAPRLTIGSYSLVDLRAGVNWGKLDLSVYVTNVFDEYGYTNFSPSFAGISSATPTRPRTYGVVARWNFF